MSNSLAVTLWHLAQPHSLSIFIHLIISSEQEKKKDLCPLWSDKCTSLSNFNIAKYLIIFLRAQLPQWYLVCSSLSFERIIEVTYEALSSFVTTTGLVCACVWVCVPFAFVNVDEHNLCTMREIISLFTACKLHNDVFFGMVEGNEALKSSQLYFCQILKTSYVI